MLKKARVLRDIDVTFISLVDKGANQKTIIWKAEDQPSGGSKSPAFRRTFKVVKTDEEKHLVYGIVYAPDEWDSHEDTASAAEIEKAAHLFMKAARTQKVDKQHDLNPDEGYVAESWIVREGDILFKEVGAWAVAIKVENDETWEMVKSGEISGISLYGTANYEEIEKMEKMEKTEQSGPLARLSKWLSEKAEGIKKGFSENVNRSQLSDAVYALWYALDDVLYDQSISNKYDALIAETQKFTQHIEKIRPMEKSETAPNTSSLEEQVETLAKSVEQLTGVVESLVKTEEPAKEEPATTEEPAKVEKAEEPEEDDTILQLKARIEQLEKASAGRQSIEKRPGEKEEEKAIGIPLFS